MEFLTRAVDSYAPFLQSSGELHDPVFGEQTQYGTAYHAYCNAVLGMVGVARDEHVERAARGLSTALAHTADPSLPAAASGFSRATGAVTRGNHRDFTWPPILKTFLLLRGLRHPATDEFAARIAEVDVLASFRARPPSNWASVWLSGEWLRIREGLSTYSVADLDDWLAVFFEELLDVEGGFYHEPGTPNSYDLFTRFHLADMVIEGYDGRHRPALERLFATGFARSLAVQLSDGSLASAHRSAGQTWTLGVQVAYFTLAATYFASIDDVTSHARARDAAALAWSSFTRFQRPGGPFSPVENVLPPAYRVGYERYTADGHYANLALAFVAGAVVNGFDPAVAPSPRDPLTRVEDAPTFRGVAHAGSYSVAVNADPAPAYDAYGITDVTFGPSQMLQLASSARHIESGTFVNLGLALREGPGRSDLELITQPPSTPTATEDGLRLSGPDHELVVSVTPAGVSVRESARHAYRTLLVPYPRDVGTGVLTEVERTATGIELTHGSERVAIDVDGAVDAVLDLPYGWESRRGLCGLVRIDLTDPGEQLTYRLRVVA